MFLAAIVLVVVIGCVILRLDDPDADLAPFTVFGGAALGTLIVLVRRNGGKRGPSEAI